MHAMHLGFDRSCYLGHGKLSTRNLVQRYKYFFPIVNSDLKCLNGRK